MVSWHILDGGLVRCPNVRAESTDSRIKMIRAAHGCLTIDSPSISIHNIP